MIKFLFLLISIFTTSCGHLLLAASVRDPRFEDLRNLRIAPGNLKVAMLFLGGFCAVVLGFGLWIFCLRHFRISYAYAMTSLSFPFMALMGNLFFGDPVLVKGWFGIGLIMLGVILLNLDGG